MPVRRTRRIVAVFGGSGADDDALALAEELGRTITERGHTLLTGGTHPAEKPVKNRAIKGAASLPWIGVDRKRSGGADWDEMEGGRGAVLTSDLDQMRNYLEALMCDGAVALTGGTGTRSEVTSALSLQRPVALVGPDWQRLPETLTRQATDWLIEGSRETFDSSRGDNHALDSRTESDALRAGLARGVRFRCFDADTSALDVVRWMEDELPADQPLPGNLPVGVHDEVAEKYDQWLTGLEP